MESFLQKVILNIRDINRLLRNIRGIEKKFSANVYEFFAVSFLTLKIAPKYLKLKVPFRQILMLDTILKVTRKLEDNNIEYFLIAGSLLGAIRQKAFAGRPSDFDIAIKDHDWQKLLALESEFHKFGLRSKNHISIRLDKSSYGGLVHIWPRILRRKTRWGMIDVHVHEQVGDNWRFIGSDAALDEVPKFQALLKFPSTDNLITAEIFGYLFPIPLNAEEYLIKAYGPNWRTPLGYKEYLAQDHIFKKIENKKPDSKLEQN